MKGSDHLSTSVSIITGADYEFGIFDKFDTDGSDTGNSHYSRWYMCLGDYASFSKTSEDHAHLRDSRVRASGS